MNLVYSNEEIKKFLNEIFINLDELDVFYCSIYYRNKYCKNETIRNASSIHLDRFLLRHPLEGSALSTQRIVRRLKDVSEFIDKEGNKLNPKGIVAYVNVNPSNPFEAALKSISSFMPTIREYHNTLAKGNSIETIAKKLKKFDIDYMKGIQTNRSKKNFVDVDIDAGKDIVDAIVVRLDGLTNLVDAIRVNTQGGAHILIPIKSLHESKLDLHNLLEDIERMHKYENIECKINSIGQVPISGTIQNGKQVTFEKIE